MLNKIFINISILLLSISYSFSYANEPVDIWSIEKEKVENITTNSDLEDNNEPSETIVINDNLTSSIEEGEILNKKKLFDNFKKKN